MGTSQRDAAPATRETAGTAAVAERARGQRYGVIVALAGFGVAGYFAYLGHVAAGVFLASVALIGMLGVLVVAGVPRPLHRGDSEALVPATAAARRLPRSRYVSVQSDGARVVDLNRLVRSAKGMATVRRVAQIAGGDGRGPG